MLGHLGKHWEKCEMTQYLALQWERWGKVQNNQLSVPNDFFHFGMKRLEKSVK